MDEVKTGIAAAVYSVIAEYLDREYSPAALADKVINPAKRVPVTVYSVLLPKTAARLREVVYSSAENPRVKAAALAMAEKMLLDRLEKKTGIRLDELSEAGLARAIGRRVGIELNSLHDPDVIQSDLVRVVVDRIEMAMAWSFEHVIKTADDLIEQLLRRAAAEIERRVPGLVLHNIKSPDEVANDVMQWAGKKIREKTGIPFRDLSDPDAVKEDVLRWVRPIIIKKLAETGKTGGKLKMTRGAIAARDAQRKFYRIHGNRHIYQSVREA